ncbi:DUF192 domain-containing protein [Bacteriovorax sp. Seq25_V]|uniref:DUF192 domain-containing protein n=1 Tax=Bacteriovorax sp. Seq25_V TaxID=1201288 RepID=UPI00038A16EB|nr:DUF192 domain-containing protein [Bacteriovorax sp. Seq25_V]EQC46829.1 hypothetical protein M900_2629 [Bacteriovorax sp. Seq25_V]
MKLKKQSGELIAEKIKIADSFFARLIGLMFKGPLVEFDSLLIKKCNSIHTFFMKYPIDVVFMNKNFKVVRVYRNIKPWRMTRIVFGATQVIEFEAGKLKGDLKVGEELELCIN